MVYRILQADEFVKWLQMQPLKTQLIVTARLERLQVEGHWGFVNRFDGLIELKWTSGIRVYIRLSIRPSSLSLREEIKMDKAKTSKRPKVFSKKPLKVFKPNTALLLDKKLIAETLVDCLLTNDVEAFQDVLVSHLRALSKTDLAKQTGLGRRTLYDLIEGKNFDPRLSTLSALLSKIAG